MSIQKVGSEFVVNLETEGNQYNSTITADASGNFVIAWTDQFGDASGLGIRARRFDALGVPLGIDFPVNSFAPGQQFQPDLASNEYGDFVAVWTNELPNQAPFLGRGADISSRHFSRDGSYVTPTDTLNVNAFTAGNQSNAQIAMNRQGNYVVVWENNQLDQTNTYGIYAQMFSANGSPINGNIPIDTSLDRDQNDPVVAIHEDGSFVVAWEEQLTPSGSEIHARRYGTNGNPLGSTFRVNANSQSGTYNPAIATTPDGGFLVAWEKSGNNDIFVRRFDDNGVPQTGEILVNTFIPNAQNSPAIAVDNVGNFVVVWDSEDQDQSEEGIYARRFQADGTPLSEELLVNTTSLDSQYNPDIAMLPNGDFVVTWTGDSNNGPDIYAQRFQIASQVTLEQVAVQVNEGQQAVLTLNRLNDLQLTSRVQMNVMGGSATEGVDYTFTPQTITFNPGETQKNITIPILQDAFTEGRETIQFSIIGGDRAFVEASHTATVTVLDVVAGQDIDPLNPRPNPQPSPGNPLSNRGTKGRDRLQGSAANDKLMGMGGNDTLVGLGGNDILNGGSGNDTLIGVNANARHPGRREVDRFIGGGGRDRMVLGDADDVFYSDGKANNRGLGDYALIQRFNRRQDRIQLHGDRTDYVLGNVPNQTGTGIFLNTERAPELIAVVQGNGSLNLNSNSFQFID